MPELKPKSFRISDETAEKFKEVAGELGGNQQDTLSKLIETYYVQKGKMALPEKQGDIEKFEGYVKCLTNLYMRSLEDSRDQREVIKEEFYGQLTAKDGLIEGLQGRLQEAEKKAKEEAAGAKRWKEKLEHLEQKVAAIQKEADLKVEGAQGMLADKEALVETLKKANQELEEKAESFRKERERWEDLDEERNSLKQENIQLKEQLQEQKYKHLEEMAALRESYLAEKERMLARAGE